MTGPLAVVLVAVAAGCGGGGGGSADAGAAARNNGQTGGGSVSRAQQQLCAALKDTSTALKQLQTLDPKTATTAQIEAPVAEAQKAARRATAAAQGVSQRQVQSVVYATSQLKAAVKQVPPGTSIQQELKQVEPQLKTTVQLVQSQYNGLACSTTS